MKKISESSSRLNKMHTKFVEILMSQHINESPFSRVRDYDYTTMRKGIICEKCKFFFVICNKRDLVCDTCSHKETVESAILRCTEEVKFLFPEKKITTNTIHEWCNTLVSKKTIRRILSRHFKKMGHGKYTYYE